MFSSCSFQGYDICFSPLFAKKIHTPRSESHTGSRRDQPPGLYAREVGFPTRPDSILISTTFFLTRIPHPENSGTISQTLNVWYIYLHELHEWLNFMVNVWLYLPYIECLGFTIEMNHLPAVYISSRNQGCMFWNALPPVHKSVQPPSIGLAV